MEITDIRIRQITEEGRMKAVATVTFDAILAVHDIKIIQGAQRLFLAMPSRRMPDGSYRDIVHPIQPAFRSALEEAVLAQYEDLLRGEGAFEPEGDTGGSAPGDAPSPQPF